MRPGQSGARAGPVILPPSRAGGSPAGRPQPPAGARGPPSAAATQFVFLYL